MPRKLVSSLTRDGYGYRPLAKEHNFHILKLGFEVWVLLNLKLIFCSFCFGIERVIQEY